MWNILKERKRASLMSMAWNEGEGRILQNGNINQSAVHQIIRNGIYTLPIGGVQRRWYT